MNQDFQDKNTYNQVSMQEIKSIAIGAMEEATKVHDNLGSKGTEKIATNAFGEQALECDLRCEEAVINSLRKAGLSGTIYSEEHGIVVIGNGDELVITLDGIDGTRRYINNPGQERYSTMLSILNGSNPSYSDYIVCASKRHASHELYIATKGEGSALITSNAKKDLKIRNTKNLKDVSKLFIDNHFEINRELYKPLVELISTHEYLEASCIYYESLASGEVDLVLECTRKRNLELACAFGLVNEAGGVMLLNDGSSLGDQKYLKFAQISDGVDIHVPIISAATEQLARAALGCLSNHI